MFIGFLEENPIIIGFIVLVLLITVVPAGMAWYKRRHPSPDDSKAVPAPRQTRFLGIQMDLAILALGLLLLLALIHGLMEAFA